MKETALKVFDRPVPYGEALKLQHRLLEQRQQDRIPDTVLLLQHTPVITLGTRGRQDGLLLSREAYSRRGIELFHAERGGDVTCHAPGQWVLYPILRLSGGSSHSYLWMLEEIALRTLADFDIEGFRREGMNGAWTKQGKVAAIGFRLKRWISFHGMSFNVCNDLSLFESIVPCGLAGEPVASMQTVLGDARPSMERVADRLLEQFSAVMNRVFVRDVEESDGG